MEKFVWSSLEEVFEKLNQGPKYLVLRNFENIIHEGPSEDHLDIDILCEDPKATREVLHGKKRLLGHVDHYEVNISGKAVEFGIRYLGDRYYCDEWENHMLDNRYMYHDGFYVLSEEDYMYSLLYHAYMHKRKVPEEYLLRFEKMAEDRGITVTKSPDEMLIDFMHENEYVISFPKDWSVPFDLSHLGFAYKKTKVFARKIYHILFGEHAVDFSSNREKMEVTCLKSWQFRKIGALSCRLLRQFVKVIKKEKRKNG